MLDYEWVRFRFLIIIGNRPRKKSMFTFLFWFLVIFYYVRCRIFNNCFEWGRSQTMLFLGGHVNIRRFFVPCNESFHFLKILFFSIHADHAKFLKKKVLRCFTCILDPLQKYHAFTWFRLRCRSCFFPCWLHGPHVKWKTLGNFWTFFKK